ncbi:hypothetical protein J7I44_15060 [Frateuria sp. MAH-13]|uniref:Uncharacterized protein n=1 Tax=Frateuria flava TaxID=2821489 RepID=A0ABS4DRE3_9GAMM|nr:hypothetical protein [Frateuria flava]MBP1475628.1 hypothetical protein [Frateuria flava]
MANVEGRVLLMAVQAVQAQIRVLGKQIDAAGDDDDVTDAEDLLMGYMKAAEALRQAYEAEERVSSNLPPYDMLVR